MFGGQFGNYNVQNNAYYLPPTEVSWPVQVGVIPPLADYFQHRHEIQELRRTAGTGGTTVLTQVLAGLGGVGKSQIAAAYAMERADDVDLLAWIEARSRSSILSSYAECAGQLGYHRRSEQEDKAVAVHWFLGWLQRTEREWLVVLDDLTDLLDMQALWPAGANGNTIVTTRRNDAALTGRGRTRVSIDLFSPQQARQYLTEKFGTGQDAPQLDEADELADDLGHLPLALAQAAAFIADRGETCAGYRRRFADRRRGLSDLFPTDALADDYRATVTTTWAISMEAADQLAPAGCSRPVLEVAGMLDANGFPSQILFSPIVVQYVTAHATSSDASSVVTSESPRVASTQDCRDAAYNLARLSLLALTPPAPGDLGIVRVHALVQRAAIDHLEARRFHTLAWTAAESLHSVWPAIENDKLLGQLLRASVDALLERSGDALWQPFQHPVLRRTGRSWGESGLVRAAVAFFDSLRRKSEQILGPQHQDTLANRHECAVWKNSAGDSSGAIADLEQLLVDEIQVPGADSPETLTTRHCIATYQGEAGRILRLGQASNAYSRTVSGSSAPTILTR
jgi:hypothetical protein